MTSPTAIGGEHNRFAELATSAARFESRVRGHIRDMVRAAAVLAATCAVAATAFAGSVPATRLSGLRGTVSMPKAICLEGEPCNGPTPGVTIVFTRNGHTKRVTSDQNGAYRVTLAPGVYLVSSPSAQPPRGHVDPGRVRVYVGRYRRVDFFVVTGIRPQ
jgi:hypothetical protein